MESIEQVSDFVKNPIPSERNPRVDCFECFAQTPCYNVLKAQYSIRQNRPKFLWACRFKKRLRMEFALSRKALTKFLRSKGIEPIVQLPESDQKLKTSFTVWELAKSMSEWMRYTISSMMSDKKAPIIEEPIPRIKEFPLTQESLKKHIEKETAKKKEEKQETVLMLKKKQQELKRLKEELKLQTEKQYCHYNEKLGDYEKEKMKYLQKLAHDHKLKLKDLIKNGDIIYQNYRSELKKYNERKMREIEQRSEINARLLQEELKRQKLMKKDVPLAPKAKETPQEPSLEEECEEESKPVSFHLEPLEVKSERRTTRSSRSSRSSRGRSIKTGHSIKMKSRIASSSRAVVSKQKSQAVPIKMDQDLKDILKDLEEVWKEIEETWSEDKKEPELPDNDLLIVRPTSIVFKDFLPYDDYEETIKVYNPTKEVIDCGFFRSYAVPHLEEHIIFEVYPEMIMRIRPGGKQDFKVIFMTEVWDEVKDGINGIIWFWSKVVKTNNFYRIPIKVECIRFTSNIKIENPIVKFDRVPSWINFGSTEYLEITNYSKIDYEVFIHRKNRIDESDSFWRILSDHPGEIQANKPTSPSNNITTSKHSNIQQDLHKTISGNISPEQAKQRIDPDSAELTQKQKLKRNTHEAHKNRSPEGIRSKEHIMSKSQSRHSGTKSRTTLAQKKLALRQESFMVAKEALGKIIEEVYQPFRIQLTRGVYLDRETKMCVPIEFIPQLAGNAERVEDQLVVSFEGRFLTKDEEVVTLIATMFELPVVISPPIVDMQVTMVGTGVWQTSFQITNESKKFIKVKIQIPGKLKKHFNARPSNLIIRPNQTEDVLVRARIGWDIYEDSGDMLDESLSLLEFPIGVMADDLPEQNLGTLAVISHPLALSIEPMSINLGFVNTFETVYEEFWLKNHTVVPLHFAFINVPECCLIMPMYGFSVIGPAQKIKLQLLYSPGVREAGKAGGQTVHMFSIICTTLERLAAEKSTSHKFNAEEEILRNSNLFQFKCDNEQVSTLHGLLKLHGDYFSELGEPQLKQLENLSFLNENLNAISFLEKKEVITPVEPHRLSISKKTIQSELFSTGEIGEKTKQEMDMLEIRNPSKKVKNIDPFISLSCMAIVTDPICELSSQELILPDTPYGSYSMHYIYLRCPNEVSGYSCYCGRFVGLHDDPKQLQIRFQFFNSEKELDVQPVSGNLNYGDKIKIYFILKPELEIQESSKEIKVKKSKLAMKSVSRLRFEPKLPPKINEIRFSRSMTQKIKNKPNTNFRARVRCLISIKGAEFPEPRQEELRCDVYSKFIRPDIYVAIPNSKKEIIFPKTVIGAKREEVIVVYNVSNRLVYVTRTHFSHKDIFTCQPLPPSPWSYGEYKGMPLEPDECLKLRLTFTPVEDNHVEEYFELKGNTTIIPLKISGYGVTPRYTFSSQFSVCKLETSHGGKIEDVITITNKCDAELRFEIMKLFQMETTSNDVFRAFFNRHLPTKNIHKEPFVDKAITTDIEEKFYESDQMSPISVEPSIVSIPPYKKASFKIVFSPKKLLTVNSIFANISSTDEAQIHDTTESPGGKEDEYATKRSSYASRVFSKSRMEEIFPTFYVQKVQVVLGRFTLVAEWLIIGKIGKDNKKRV